MTFNFTLDVRAAFSEVTIKVLLRKTPEKPDLHACVLDSHKSAG